MNYFMDFDPYLIRERNEGMVREVTSMGLQVGSRNNEDDQERKEKRVMSKKTRRSAILLLAGIAALVLSSTAASAALRIGTDNGEEIVGTGGPDSITGKGGTDRLKGMAGNDVYNFADGFGTDTLEDRHFTYDNIYGGIDSLNFSKVSTPIEAYLIPQWGGRYAQTLTTDARGVKNTVQLTIATQVENSTEVENVTGGSENDRLYGGGETNTLKPGGGSRNELWDYGGNNGSVVNNTGLPDLRTSSDMYKGFGAAPNGASNYVYDWGGTEDKLVLPGESSDYYLDRVNLDADWEKQLGKPATDESLEVYDPTNNSSVFVVGHFGEYRNFTGAYAQNGQIEELVFADTVIYTMG